MARPALLWWALCGLLVLVHPVRAQAPAQAAPARVSTPDEFLEALENPAVATILVVKPLQLTSTWGPARVSRQLLITSPMRAMIDWCDAQCNAGNSSQPAIIVEQGGMVTFNRLFFRNFIPDSPSSYSNPALNFASSPVPMVSPRGGQITFNLVVMHWTRAMLWVTEEPGSFWAAASAAESGVTSHPVGSRMPFNTSLTEARVFVVKQFSVDGSVTVTDCYMPADIFGCLTDQPFNTTLIYCPYTFKDSLRNPWVDKVMVFHDIGLDRLVNSYRDPVTVNRSVTYVSCPGTRHRMEMDNITNSVLVTSGGGLTFKNMVLQGSKSQNKTDWPSNVPLLLSTFKPVGSGTITLRDSSVLVQNMDDLVRALKELPAGGSSAVEVPNLQPTYAGLPPAVGDHGFTIKIWQLQLGRFLLSRAGGQSIMERVGTGNGLASWQFFNVSVGTYRPEDCFNAAVVQGSLAPGGYASVASGQALLDQLANTTARYIRVTGDIVLPANLPLDHVAVNRIVEVRACEAGAVRRIDWANNRAAVSVGGNAIFQGSMEMAGLGWGQMQHQVAQKGRGQLVDALHPGGTGIVEYEDVTLVGEMPPPLWANDAGEAGMASVLGVPDLDTMPLNMSLLAPGHLLLRGFYMNRSSASSGQDGLESFLDVNVAWRRGSERAAPAPVPLAAIVVPVVVGTALLAAAGLLLCLCCRKRRAGGSSCKPAAGLLPKVHADASKGGGNAFDGSNHCDHSSPSARIAAGACSASDGGGLDRTVSGVSGTSGVSKARSGPSQDIMMATRHLALAKTGGDADELVLQSVLGEGSYGKVFRASWRGTVVAVKIMILPSYMTGKEKREKMAVMETAISSSLSHPNVVQTFTYAVEPVRANTNLKEPSRASGPGASISLHDSTLSWGDQQRANDPQKPEEGSGASGGAFSWEVRLVQEFCDQGSLRDALKISKFRHDDGSPRLGLMIDTALDVARAMAHLHHHNILHSDLKARNVLLRSDAADPRGFAAKVADFGLSLTIDPASTHISNAFQGTMTHMAPETLMHGQVSRASDVYGYGILLWELFTGEHAYRGVPRALLGHKITKQGLRPVFPADTPFEWQFLACRCWETDAAIRPTFDQILEELKRMKRKVVPGATAPGSGSPGGSPPSSLPLDGLSGVPVVPMAAAVAAISSRLTGQSALPCINEPSDTLPSAVDRQLWDEHHQAALLQQEEALRRRSSTATAPSGSPGSHDTPLAAAAAAAASARPAQAAQWRRPAAWEREAHLTLVDDDGDEPALPHVQQQQQQQQQGGSTDAYADPPSGLMLLSTADSMSALR